TGAPPGTPPRRATRTGGSRSSASPGARQDPRTSSRAAGDDQPPFGRAGARPPRPSPSSVTTRSGIRGHERALLIIGVAFALIVGGQRMLGLVLSSAAGTPTAPPAAPALDSTASPTLRATPSPVPSATPTTKATPTPKPTPTPTPTPTTGIGTPFTITEFDSDPRGT